MTTYIITSDRWAQNPTECTLQDLQEQARIYSRDNDRQPVTVLEATRNGNSVVVDNTGEIIAVSAQDYDR